MMKILIFLMIFAAIAGNVSAQNKIDAETQAKAFVDALARKDFAAAYALFADNVKDQFPAEAMPQVWAQITGEYGEFRALKDLKKATDGKSILATLEFAKKSEVFLFSFDAQGEILGFTLAPPEMSGETPKYETPAYADANAFTETETTVGAGEWSLPATLTMPKGKMNVPALVLVHGSGANDRDETLGSIKAFKDLAWGLASQGVAVLRYEKRSKQYGAKLAAVKNLTVDDETVDDAAFAARLLMKTPNVNAKKVFVLGHSLGGYLLPRIAAKEKMIAGFISFAGATKPLQNILPAQYIYIFGLDGTISPDEQKKIDEVKKVAAKISSLTKADLNSGEFYFGAPASYYLDLQNYNPPQEAKKISQPMLILQGESDYQVTMNDFADWKNALGGRQNVTFKSYPNLTHHFTEAAGGKPKPQDYQKGGHVSALVVSDIAEWILKTNK